jgi:hypothetical protein
MEENVVKYNVSNYDKYITIYDTSILSVFHDQSNCDWNIKPSANLQYLVALYNTGKIDPIFLDMIFTHDKARVSQFRIYRP